MTHTFRVTNTSDRVVRLLEESHSCTCSRVDLDLATLSPGESTPLTVHVNLPGDYHHGQVVSTIRTDHSQHPYWVYRLDYTTYPRARFVPAQIDFGTYELDRDSRGSALVVRQEVMLETFDRDGVKPRRPWPGLLPPEGFSARFMDLPASTRLANGLTRTVVPVQLAFDQPPVGSGAFSRFLKARVPGGAEAECLLTWRSQGPIVVHPAIVHFGTVEVTTPVQKTVLLESSANRPFRLLSTESSNLDVHPREAADPEFPTPDRSSHVLLLTLSPAHHEPQPGPLARSGTLVITTDLGPLSTITIPWSVFYRSQREIERVLHGP